MLGNCDGYFFTIVDKTEKSLKFIDNENNCQCHHNWKMQGLKVYGWIFEMVQGVFLQSVIHLV